MKKKKCVAMICRTKEHRDLKIPDLYLWDELLNVGAKTKINK